MSAHDHVANAGISNRVKTLVGELGALGLLRETDLDETVERFLLAATPRNGARLVARAWVDPAFKSQLLTDAAAAMAELGIDMRHWAPVELRAVENTDAVHNVLVCTLCSCYPIGLLGPSPAWYKSEAYRSRVVRDPRGILAEFGVTLPEQTRIDVWDSTAELRYIVIPNRPAGTDDLDETQLAALVTRNGLIGTAVV